MIEHGFVESTIDGFLRDYKKSLAFAGLLDDVLLKDFAAVNDSPRSALKVGDYIQWESQGVLRLPVARKLTHLSPDGTFAFVEGNSTGIPLGEVIEADAPETEVVERAMLEKSVHKSLGRLQPSSATMLREIFSLPDGSAVSIEWPTSFTADAFEDFTDWLTIVKRKISRTVQPSSVEPEATYDASAE